MVFGEIHRKNESICAIGILKWGELDITLFLGVVDTNNVDF